MFQTIYWYQCAWTSTLTGGAMQHAMCVQHEHRTVTSMEHCYDLPDTIC